MSTSELAAVEALLMRVLPDPMGFGKRVLDELLERLATEPLTSRPTVVPGYLADLGVPVGGPTSGSTAGPVTGPAAQEVADRHLLLGAALGACECWGEDPGCAICGGQGSAGWVPPDPELYEEYVAPAVRRTVDRDLTDHQPAEGAST
jgi:hypothetical protein